MGRPAVEVVLSETHRSELERRLRRWTTSQREASRIRVILASEGTRSANAVAQEVGMARSAVERWRRRFRESGIDGLRDSPRPGRPGRLTPEQRLEIIAIACEPLPGDDGEVPDDGRVTRSIDDIVAAARERGVAEAVGWGTVQRLLASAEIKPHRDQQWLHSIDPDFREKVTAICDLYLSPPEADDVVLCIDEKPGMQALQRKHPPRSTARGRMRRREFEYKRHGTQTLIAAFNVHTGHVLAHCGDTRKAEDLVAFMDEVATFYSAKRVRVVWDCLNIHYDGPDGRWRRFNERHGGRFIFTYTPKHASWVNQIECFFSILQRSSLNRGSFADKAQLRETVMAFIRHWNDALAHPFHWTFTGYPLQTGVDEAALHAA